MSFSNQEAATFLDLPMTASTESDRIDVRTCVRGSVQVTWTGASATTAVVRLQKSNDGANWVNVGNVSIGAASGSDFIEANNVNWAWCRVIFVKNTETTGTVSAHSVFKGK